MSARWKLVGLLRLNSVVRRCLHLHLSWVSAQSNPLQAARPANYPRMRDEDKCRHRSQPPTRSTNSGTPTIMLDCAARYTIHETSGVSSVHMHASEQTLPVNISGMASTGHRSSTDDKGKSHVHAVIPRDDGSPTQNQRNWKATQLTARYKLLLQLLRHRCLLFYSLFGQLASQSKKTEGTEATVGICGKVSNWINNAGQRSRIVLGRRVWPRICRD